MILLSLPEEFPQDFLKIPFLIQLKRHLNSLKRVHSVIPLREMKNPCRNNFRYKRLEL